MNLSIREVSELAGRCFAAAGLPDGTARTNASAIWWTEAYRGTGLATLHGLLDELGDWDRSELSLSEQASMISMIDSGGQPSLVSSGAAVDLSCSQAQRHGIGITYADVASDDGTLPTIGHTAYQAAKRGYVSMTLYSDGRGNAGTVVGTPDEPAPAIAEVTHDKPSAAYAEIRDVIERDLHQYRNYPLLQAFFDREERNRYSNAEVRLLDRLLRRSMEPTDGDAEAVAAGYLMICIDPLQPRYPNEVQGIVEEFVAEEAEEFTTVFEPEAVGEQIGEMVEAGVEVDEAVWREIFDYSSGVLAPPFEGSREDAGFDLN